MEIKVHELCKIRRNNQYLSFDSCKQLAQEGNYKYFSTQNASNGIGWCAASNNLSTATQYGVASNCSNQNNNWMGGPWSNAIYSVNPDGNYFLILQDDGNMCVYRGTGPNDNQGFIWGTQTNGKQQSANANVVASKGKYGQNWMASGGTLAPGDFIGSSDGKLALVMQTDGNLVLYTYQMETNCQKMSDGNTGGGLLANATYDIGKVAVAGNMGKLAYIDADSGLHVYPNNNAKYINNYETLQNVNTAGNDINGASFGNATVDSCKTACNNNSKCAGFVYDNKNKICYPKNNKMYPYGGSANTFSGVDIYVRNKQPSTPPIGVTSNTTNIDTIKYKSYVNGGNISSKYGLANANSVEKQQLEHLQTKLSMLSNQIGNLTGRFGAGSTMAEYQGEKNTSGIGEYVEDIKDTNTKIKTVAGVTTGGLQNILKDSDIVVLQKNYDYLFWSILAAGTVLVTMNIVKKE